MSAPVKTCTDCDGIAITRGMCSKHYQRWKRGRDLSRPMYAVCQVKGCERTPRSRHSQHCEMHYYRIRRNGTSDTVAPTVPDAPCAVAECAHQAERTDGMCRMHHLRLANRGDAGFTFAGSDHYRWTGDDATYWAVHQRVRALRGSASKFACVDCGCAAKHWSYDHKDAAAKFDPVRGQYSVHLDRYEPRCVQCHKRFDLAFIAANGGRQ